jgi:HSP90 family molecular chaperone
MIQARSPVILPDWLRFVRGVVDSEDIPLNISRETMQDSALIKRIRNVLTKKVISFLESEGKRDAAAYNKFHAEFGSFLKEGVIADPNYKDSIARLLRFESSRLPAGEVCSLDEYLARMPSEQKHIHFLCMPSRSVAELSPYYEQFKANNTEVLFVYTQMDELALSTLQEYGRRKLVSIESSDAEEDLPSKRDKAAEEEAKAEKDEQKGDKADKGPSKLTHSQTQDLVKWLERTLSSRVSSVKVSNRLVSSPCIITDHESSSVRRLMHMVGDPNLNMQRKQKLEINATHPLMVKLALAAKQQPERASMVADQLYDNAMIAAGLLDDPRTMLGRLNTILESSLPSSSSSSTTEEAAAKTL